SGYAVCSSSCRCDLLKSLRILAWLDNNLSIQNSLELVGIVTDDTESDVQKNKLGSYSLRPKRGYDWIHPLDLKLGSISVVEDLTFHIQSSFRHIPLSNYTRAYEKERFEDELYKIVAHTKPDILISDHFMVRLDKLLKRYGLYGRVLN